ncbi:MAG TPA: hypothetical protein VNJ70_17005 [Thermoanaerobaculia bacterium]|nr:hypothetical protein [Thermoanaerobaculia bacterium]
MLVEDEGDSRPLDQIVASDGITGKRAHDGCIVALMLSHVSRILTLNGGDFASIAGVVVLEPQAVAG